MLLSLNASMRYLHLYQRVYLVLVRILLLLDLWAFLGEARERSGWLSPLQQLKLA